MRFSTKGNTNISSEIHRSSKYHDLLQDRSNSPRCLLSSDTQETAGDNAYQLSPGAVYAEKDCKETSDSSSRLPEISNSNWALASSGGGRDPISLMRDRIYEALPQVIFIHSV